MILTPPPEKFFAIINEIPDETTTTIYELFKDFDARQFFNTNISSNNHRIVLSVLASSYYALQNNGYILPKSSLDIKIKFGGKMKKYKIIFDEKKKNEKFSREKDDYPIAKTIMYDIEEIYLLRRKPLGKDIIQANNVHGKTILNVILNCVRRLYINNEKLKNGLSMINNNYLFEDCTDPAKNSNDKSSKKPRLAFNTFGMSKEDESIHDPREEYNSEDDRRNMISRHEAQYSVPNVYGVQLEDCSFGGEFNPEQKIREIKKLLTVRQKKLYDDTVTTLKNKSDEDPYLRFHSESDIDLILGNNAIDICTNLRRIKIR
ncbi:hypothetical protein RhiirA4_483559 [Rhizophagus irregularis]|uniref:Uncharacterized protein n=1 Tax=Rhizophagus irregularis TaxID=588596 RepID=A0A2I1HMQ4_9GLOM|nr:hypothetical protein RhiirA4_483559 [Rhizophagus irregularis]